jgi:hypothetical protein
MDGRTEAAAKTAYFAERYNAWDDESEKIRGGYERTARRVLAAADGWDREHGVIRTDRRTPDDAVIGYCVRIDGRTYLLQPSDVDIVRPGAPQGEAS